MGIIIFDKQICFSAPSTLAATSCMCGGEVALPLEMRVARRRGVINGELPTCLLPRIPIQPAGSSSRLRRVARAAGPRGWVGALQDDGAHEVLHAHLAVAVEVGLSDHLLALQRGREGAAVLQVRCGGSVGAQASCAVHACVRRGCRR